MRKSGALRRVVILVAFAWGYSFLVLNSSLFMWSYETRQWLHWLLYGAVAWGVVTLFADRVSQSSKTKETEHHDDDSS